MRVLVIGASSFVAKGLSEVLRASGHEVWRYERGPAGREDGVLRGNLASLAEQLKEGERFDAVINYAILKDAGIEENLQAMAGIVKFCQAAGVQRLLHFSSISVYDGAASIVDEASQVAPDPLSKGAYASLKVATDQFLLQQELPSRLKIAFLRPGFVLGPGLLNPFPGMGFRLPVNRLLVFGGGTAKVPIVSRDHLHQMVLKILALPKMEQHAVFHGFDPEAPDRFTFLQTCNDVLGLSNGIWRFPGWLWLATGAVFDVGLRLMGKSPLFGRSLRNASSKQTYACVQTEQALGLKERVDLPALIRTCFSGQSQTPRLPALPALSDVAFPAGGLAVVGAGRIVGTAHVEAFRSLAWPSASIQYYDLSPRRADFGEVQPLPERPFTGQGFWTVATPATAHVKAVPLLSEVEGVCLLEKPLALNREEWALWQARHESGLTVGVCHNYRFKANVRKFRQFVQTHPTGDLLGAQLLFQSPPVRGDASPWIRQERISRSLLMDYSIHFLDLACLFAGGPWQIQALDWVRDGYGDTELIRGRCANERYPLTFHLQQGFGPRTCRVEFVFRNYTAVLAFFPDSFHVRMAPDGGGVASIAAATAWQGTFAKVKEKMTRQRADGSHAYCYADLLQRGRESEIAMPQLASYYDLLFQLGDRVYGSPAAN